MKVSERVSEAKKLDELIELQKETNNWLEMIANQSASNGESLAQIVTHWVDQAKHRVKESHWGKVSIIAVCAALFLGLIEIGDLGIIRDRAINMLGQMGIYL
jgi:ElaB/YqjD/DUF883 family membrane-anchored ribosome-binding protein